MKRKHRFRPYTCSIQRQQPVDFWSFPRAYQYYCFMFYTFILLSFFCNHFTPPVQLF